MSYWKLFEAYIRDGWIGNFLGGSESFAATQVMSFQVGIGSLGVTMFFKVGLCTTLRTMGTLTFIWYWQKLFATCDVKSNSEFLDSNGIWTHNHLVCKRTLDHLGKLGKWLNVHLRSRWLWVQVLLQSQGVSWHSSNYRM